MFCLSLSVFYMGSISFFQERADHSDLIMIYVVSVEMSNCGTPSEITTVSEEAFSILTLWQQSVEYDENHLRRDDRCVNGVEWSIVSQPTDTSRRISTVNIPLSSVIQWFTGFQCPSSSSSKSLLHVTFRHKRSFKWHCNTIKTL